MANNGINEMRKICIVDKHQKIQISDNFYSYELDCNCASPRCFFTLFSKEVLAYLELSRKLCGSKPIYPTSGFRCYIHNKNVKGVEKSKHCKGLAVDIPLPSHLTFKEFVDILRNKVRWPICIPYEDKNFIHCAVV